MQKKAVIYIHGKGGSTAEAEHYKPFFKDCDVLGLDYKSETPWEAKTEFSAFFKGIAEKYGSVSVIANSVGAFFTVSALCGAKIEKAYFISPVVDMEGLITDMMAREHVTEKELKTKKEIKTDSGQVLSWEYLCYVRENPVKWDVPTGILYGENDSLTSLAAIKRFADSCGAEVTVMPSGEHWFHTKEQMEFLDGWLKKEMQRKRNLKVF